LVGQTTLENAELTPGSHLVTVSLSQTLDINPSKKFELAVADSADQVPEASKTDNVASFRTRIVAANDPPLSTASGVNSTEIFYQHALVPDALRPDEQILNSWEVVPAGGAAAGVVYYYMTGIVNSHEGLDDFYLQQIVPLLATGAPLPIPASPVPTVPTNGGPAFPNKRIGYKYEYRLLRSRGVPAPVATHLLRSFATLNSMLADQKFPAADVQIKKMDRFIGKQSGRTIPKFAAACLQEQLALSPVLLFSDTPVSMKAARAIAHLAGLACQTGHSSAFIFIAWGVLVRPRRVMPWGARVRRRAGGGPCVDLCAWAKSR
jgi:hypothetical protein